MLSDIQSTAIALFKAHPMPPLQEHPVYSEKVSCGHSGFASPAQGYEQKLLDLNKHLITNPPATYFFMVTGNSMNRARVFDETMVIVDCSKTPRSSDIVVAAVDGEWMVKRLYKWGGVVKLLPDSDDPSYKPVVFSEGQELRIFGVVTYVIAKPL